MTFNPNIQTNTDNNNSTSSPLGSGEEFVGLFVILTGYNTLILTINSNADGKIEIIFSEDGISNDLIFKDTYFSNTDYVKNFQLIKKYYKVRYINGNSSQSTFNLNSRLSTNLDSKSTISYDEVDEKNSNNFSLDAFGKLRVSNPNTLLDIKFPSGAGTTEYKSNSELVCIKNTGGGSATYLNSICTMSVTTNGDSYISQSRKYCVYQPGKSQLFLASGVINSNSNSSTVTSRIGYFDNNNGMFYEYSGNNLYIVLRNDGSDIKILQNDWNIDKMDGYGKSGLNLDLTKCQLFVIDFEWLGVGRIRYGFYANGIINYCHQIKNINNLTTPYSLTGNLPVRFEISSVGGSGSLKQICSSVISEGGYNPIGKTFSVSTGTSSITLTTSAETSILAIKGISTYNHENIIPINISVLNVTTNTGIIFKIRLFQAPVTDPGTFSWSNVNNNSVIRYAIAPTGVTFTNSIIINEGYALGKTEIAYSSLSDVFNNINQLTSDINGNSDILLITATVTFGSNPDIYSSLSWQEVY